MSKKSSFFDEWEDEKDVQVFAGIFLVIAILITFWLMVNFVEVFRETSIFLIMGVFVILGGYIEDIADRNNLIDILGATVKFGTKYRLIISSAIGAIVGFVLLLSNTFSLVNPASIVAGSLFSFVFIVILAPIWEEFFFRSTLLPTLIHQLDGAKVKYAGLIGVIIISLAFGFFHFVVYGASIPLIIGAVIFSLIACFGNYGTKSIGFGLAMHLIVNYFAWTGGFF